MTGGWIKPQNKELRNVYCSPNIINHYVGYVQLWGNEKHILAGISEGKTPTGRLENTKINAMTWKTTH